MLVQAKIPYMPQTEMECLRLNFIYKLDADCLAARLAMMPGRYILKHIPQRIGTSKALDDAVRCVSVPHNSGAHVSLTIENGGLYLIALRSLQAALHDPLLANTPETLAAAALLQMHEHYIDHSGRRWIHHARGVVTMLKLRGPARITDGVERAILQAQTGNIFMAALLSGQECFLASPGWSEVIHSAPLTEDGENMVLMKMISTGLPIPGLLRSYSRFMQNLVDDIQDTSDTDRDTLTNLFQNLMKLRHQFRSHLFRQEEAADTGNDAMLLASYAIMGFFFIITNIMLSTLVTSSMAFLPQPSSPAVPEIRTDCINVFGNLLNQFNAFQSANSRSAATAAGALRMTLSKLLYLDQWMDYEEKYMLQRLDLALHRYTQ
ncbi:hypothetical protein M433DRAFT_157674 [Acidomyces richmondensis BFW]|nr:MAG: hypothetical protein FE78DRAFT_84198 [Acidomyces sp. 'richmondensis']KYG42630.1 hypothetical protein M433DRAFT_157674 [Acidomyces richmondensis BFW]